MVEFSETDEEKVVLDSERREIGVVEDVRNGSAFVRPLADLEAPVRTELGWHGDDREVYRLQDGRVESVTNDEVWLEAP